MIKCLTSATQRISRNPSVEIDLAVRCLGLPRFRRQVDIRSSEGRPTFFELNW